MRPDPSRLVTALRAARSQAGPLLAAGGVVLEVIGWFCVSGESLTARQLPYIASASIPGAALIVSGAVLTAGRHPAGDETARRVAELHALLVEYAPDDAGETAIAGRPGGAREARGDGGPVRPSPRGPVPSETLDSPPAAPAPEAAPTGDGDGAIRDNPAAGGEEARAAGPADAAGASAEGAGHATGPVAVPDGTMFHDPACGLVRGKSPARVTGEQIAARGLLPCPVCAPGPG